MRKAPAAWREEILLEAQAVERSNAAADVNRQTWFTNLLWPCPRAWAGLAAVWVAILAVNLGSTTDSTSHLAKAEAISDSSFAERRKLLTDLLVSFNTALPEPAEPPKNSTPRPQSRRQEEFLTA